jgi:hypothetical protein
MREGRRIRKNLGDGCAKALFFLVGRVRFERTTNRLKVSLPNFERTLSYRKNLLYT